MSDLKCTPNKYIHKDVIHPIKKCAKCSTLYVLKRTPDTGKYYVERCRPTEE